MSFVQQLRDSDVSEHIVDRFPGDGFDLVPIAIVRWPLTEIARDLGCVTHAGNSDVGQCLFADFKSEAGTSIRFVDYRYSPGAGTVIMIGSDGPIDYERTLPNVLETFFISPTPLTWQRSNDAVVARELPGLI